MTPDMVLGILLLRLPGGESAYRANLERHQKAFGTENAAVSTELLLKTAGARGLSLKEIMDSPLAVEQITAEVASFEPRDAVEARLAMQMVTVHNLALDHMARQQTILDGHEQMAARLLHLFATQVETLKRYRSSGKQSIAVRHVHVHRGSRKSAWGLTDGGRGEGKIKKIVNEPHAP